MSAETEPISPQQTPTTTTKEQAQAALQNSTLQLQTLQSEKQSLTKNREAEEEQQWTTFQSRYDDALKIQQHLEQLLSEKNEDVVTLQKEQERIMELKTNKETEVQMSTWQIKYDAIIQERQVVQDDLERGKEQLSQLREVQSAYMKKREEEDGVMWREFQERYDKVVEEKLCWEAVLLKIGEQEEKEELKGDDVKSSEESSPPLMEQSLGQSNDDKEEQDVDGETAGENVALDDSSNIMISADAKEICDDDNASGSVDDNKEGETPTTKEDQHRVDGDDIGLNENETRHKVDVVDDGIDDTTSLGATTITSRVSRAIDYKKDLSALDKFLPAKDDISFVSRRSSRSVSSRSIRRRDVIKPIDLDEQSEITTSSPVATQEGVFIATMDGTVDMQPLPSSTNDGNGAENSLEQSNPQCDQQFAMIVRDPKQRTPRQTNLEPEESRAALHLGNDPPGESPTDRPYINHNDGVIHDPSSPIGGGRFRNVQWVDPKDAHDEDIDFGLLNAYERMSGRNIVNSQSSPSNSVEQQQQHIMDPPEDLPKNNYYPEEDDSSGKARLTKASVLGDNRRMRIATISSGYKTANYFVREDLDTRIYFQDLEDAINYMSRRGYIRMKKEDEEEWIKLIGKAHGVVKVGPTKKKQRYRKGKLVMILSKEINDNDDDEHKKPQECDSSEVTDRTSLGRSVRCGFKSYSEKFLAEQEADKQSTLLQLTNEAAVERAGHLLPLTNGEVLSAVDESTLESSKASMGSDRKGVYGGGVRYFTTDNDEAEYQSSDEEDGSEEEDDDDDEEESVEEFDGGNEENEGGEEEEEDHDEIHEVDGSMGSMFSDEESFMDNRSAGVDSLSASSTLSSGYPSPLQRKETYREPPNGLMPIDDDSMAS